MQSAQDGPVLLTFNAGSSSFKLGLFAPSGGVPPAHRHRHGRSGPRAADAAMVENGTAADVALKAAVPDDMRAVRDETLGWISRHFTPGGSAAAGHRVVHGGDVFAGSCEITDDAFEKSRRWFPSPRCISRAGRG